jgi:hypothetical protein
MARASPNVEARRALPSIGRVHSPVLQPVEVVDILDNPSEFSFVASSPFSLSSVAHG